MNHKQDFIYDPSKDNNQCIYLLDDLELDKYNIHWASNKNNEFNQKQHPPIQNVPHLKIERTPIYEKNDYQRFENKEKLPKKIDEYFDLVRPKTAHIQNRKII